MKKNIVHFITGLNTGGAEIMLLKLLSAINLDKYNILIVSLIDKGTIGHKIESLGIKVYALNLSRKRPVTFSLLSLPFVLKRFKPNVFHGWMYHANLLLSFISLLYPNVRVIWGIRHSLYDINKEKLLTKIVIYLCKFFSKKCTNIVFNSSVSLEQHVKYGFSENNCSVIHNGFDTINFSPDNITEKQSNNLKTHLKIPENKNLIGFVARFHPMKGHKNFIKAAIKVINKREDVCFILVGSEVSNKKLYHLIPKKMRSFFYLLGERSDIAALNSIFDISVNCSNWGEGFSNSICESMLMEVPCIATNVGESGLILKNCGVIIEPNNEELLANSIINLLSKSLQERKEIGKLERSRIVDNFSIEVICMKYESLYLV